MITRTPGVVDSNIGVRFIDTSLPMIRKNKKTPISAWEDVMNYIEKLPNKLKYASMSKTIKLIKELQNKMKKAKEEHDKLFEAIETESALRNCTKAYTINGIDGESFLNNAEDSITKILRENRQTKVKLIFKCKMIKEGPDGEIIRPFDFHSGIMLNLAETDENELYDIMIETIKEKMDKLESAEGTGWRLHGIIKLELHTAKWIPLRGSSYIELPKELKDKKAIINIKNDDNKCFLWCVLSALYPVKKNNDRIDKTLKSNIETLNTTGINYPVSLPDIKKFECLNSNISISVLGYNKMDKVYPLRVSEYIDREHDIVLMLICDEEKKHYCLVNNLSRLLGLQTSKHLNKRLFCLRCFNSFNCEKSLNKHKEYCGKNECVKIVMPEKGTIRKFKNYLSSERVPFMIYADTESLIKSLQTCEPSPQSSYTKEYQNHVPISFSYYIKCFDDNVFKPRLRCYTGENAMQKFVEWLEEDIKIITNIPEVDMTFEKEETERYKK